MTIFVMSLKWRELHNPLTHTKQQKCQGNAREERYQAGGKLPAAEYIKKLERRVVDENEEA